MSALTEIKGTVELAPEVLDKIRQASGLRTLQEQRDSASNLVVVLRADISILEARLRAEINHATAIRANLEATMAILERERATRATIEAELAAATAPVAKPKSTAKSK